jgi:hypothetical protein
MKKKLDKLLRDTLDVCFTEGYLKRTRMPEFVVEVPNNPDHGHFATNLAMILAREQGNRPRKIAEIIMQHLTDHDHLIEKTEIGGAGFINFFVATEQWRNLLCQVIDQGDAYGRSSIGNAEKIMVEFVASRSSCSVIQFTPGGNSSPTRRIRFQKMVIRENMLRNWQCRFPKTKTLKIFQFARPSTSYPNAGKIECSGN